MSSFIKSYSSISSFASDRPIIKDLPGFDAIIVDPGFKDVDSFCKVISDTITGSGFNGKLVSIVPIGTKSLFNFPVSTGIECISVTKPYKKSSLRTALLGDKTEKAISQANHNHTMGTVRVRTGLSILVVEDNHVSQVVAFKLLNQYGCVVDVVSNGFEAIKMLGLKKYDVVFMDIQMPVMNGYEATKLIRSATIPDVNPDMLIIAMTANAMKGDDKSCLKVGMNDYISKPILPENVKNMMEKYFKV